MNCHAEERFGISSHKKKCFAQREGENELRSKTSDFSFKLSPKIINPQSYFVNQKPLFFLSTCEQVNF